jgi:hypothetical protein
VTPPMMGMAATPAARRIAPAKIQLDEIDGEGNIDFLGASMISVNMGNAKLKNAQLEECDLLRADLTGSELIEANLQMTTVTGAIFDDANLERANLADLRGWQEIRSIRGAKISGIRNAPAGFRQWAVQNGALEFVIARGASASYKSHNAEESKGNDVASEATSASLGPIPNSVASEVPSSAPPTISSAPLEDEPEKASTGVKYFDAKNVSLTAGDMVSHDKFGLGTVISATGTGERAEAEIDFGKEIGVKTLVLRYTPMTKL